MFRGFAVMLSCRRLLILVLCALLCAAHSSPGSTADCGACVEPMSDAPSNPCGSDGCCCSSGDVESRIACDCGAPREPKPAPPEPGPKLPLLTLCDDSLAGEQQLTPDVVPQKVSESTATALLPCVLPTRLRQEALSVWRS